jgi:succinoglycan biosynthesis protein ExoL
VPCLAVHGFEVGSVLERYRIGFTFAPSLEDQLVRFFETLTPADYDHIRHHLSAVPTSMFVADNEIARLCTMLGEVTPQRD